MIDNELYSLILPGRIVEYFPDDQTATVKVSAERIIRTQEDAHTIYDRGGIYGVPVHTPSGGGWSITMPIKPGDTCILFFSQIGYDHWLYDDNDKAGTLANLPKPWLRRQFSQSDGFALVGLNTLPRAIDSYHATDSQWRNTDVTQVISLKEDLDIELTSPTGITINAPNVVVNAEDVVVNTETSTINASTSTDIISPLNTITGPLDVTGVITAPSIIAAAHLQVATKIMQTHTHAGVHGETAPPT